VGEWPEPAFCAAVRAALPAHGACGAEVARALYADGHALLDVRSALELDTEGKVLPQMPGVLHVPFVRFTKRFDAASGRKLVDKAPNDDFVAAVRRVAPDAARGLVVLCSGAPSQGVLRADAAADALRAAGYTRVVVLSRGYAVRLLSLARCSSLMRASRTSRTSHTRCAARRRSGRCASPTSWSAAWWASSSPAAAQASSSAAACRRRARAWRARAWTRCCATSWPTMTSEACTRMRECVSAGGCVCCVCIDDNNTSCSVVAPRLGVSSA
jgi:rhodanese-related sulfurtransferase